MSYVYRRSLGALIAPTTTRFVAPAPAPIPAKVVAPVVAAPAPQLIPVKVVAPTPVLLPPPPSPVLAPIPAKVIAPVVAAPAPVVTAPVQKTTVLDLLMPAVVQPAPVQRIVAPAPAPILTVAPAVTGGKTAGMELLQPTAPPITAAVVSQTAVQAVLDSAPVSVMRPAAQAAESAALVAASKGGSAAVVAQAAAEAAKDVVSRVSPAAGLNVAAAVTKATQETIRPSATVVTNQGARMSLSIVDKARKMKADQAKRAKLVLDAARRQAATQRIVGGRLTRPGLRVGQQPAFVPPGLRGRGIAVPGGQMVTPAVVAMNCGAGMEMRDGACQAVPGSSISPTTGTVAQPAQAQQTSLPSQGPVTYSQWSPYSGQAMIGPAPSVESTPDEDEAGVQPAAPAPVPMSTGTKVAMGLGAAIVGFFVLKGLGVFRS